MGILYFLYKCFVFTFVFWSKGKISIINIRAVTHCRCGVLKGHFGVFGPLAIMGWVWQYTLSRNAPTKAEKGHKQ